MSPWPLLVSGRFSVDPVAWERVLDLLSGLSTTMLSLGRFLPFDERKLFSVESPEASDLADCSNAASTIGYFGLGSVIALTLALSLVLAEGCLLFDSLSSVVATSWCS